MLDGLAFAKSDAGPRLVVTTAPLVEAWLKSFVGEPNDYLKLPGDALAAVKVERFYELAIAPDAAYAKSADLPVTKPVGVDWVVAQLGGFTQEERPNPANAIVVALRKGGRVFIAETRPATAIGKIAACDAIWDAASKKADKAEGGKDKIVEQGETDYHACFNARAPKESFFPAVLKEAQDLTDRIAAAR